MGVTYVTVCHTLRPPDTDSMRQWLIFKIGYVCQIPQEGEVGHIWPTVYDLRVGNGCNMDIVRWAWCVVVDPVAVSGTFFLFWCAKLGRNWFSVAALTWVFRRCVGAQFYVLLLRCVLLLHFRQLWLSVFEVLAMNPHLRFIFSDMLSILIQ